MSQNQTPEPPQPVAEADSLVGVAMHDLLAVIRSRIDQCENEENRLEELMLEKRAERRKLQLEAIKLEFRVIVGSIVTGRDGLEYRVTSIYPSWKTPWIKGNPRKKDGTWGNAERHLYGDWKISSANDEWWHRRDQAPIQLETLSPVATHGLFCIFLRSRFRRSLDREISASYR
jgi:hypothetical protein